MRLRLYAGLTLAMLLCGTAASAQQTGYQDPIAGAVAQGKSPSELLAGLRSYSDEAARALLVVMAEPGALDTLARDPEWLRRPEEVASKWSAAAQAALRTLSFQPDLIAIAAAAPQEAAALGRMYAESPDATMQQLERLRAGYTQVRYDGARLWQQTLEADPVALGQYRELLNSMCQEQRKADDRFPTVQVLSREYYYACLPNEQIVGLARQQDNMLALRTAIDRWWIEYQPFQTDASAIKFSRLSVAPGVPAGVIAALPAADRQGMWAASDKPAGNALGLAPVILQPLADQPSDAQYEYGLVEHVRLWGLETPSDDAQQAPAYADASDSDAPPFPLDQNGQPLTQEQIDQGYAEGSYSYGDEYYEPGVADGGQPAAQPGMQPAPLQGSQGYPAGQPYAAGAEHAPAYTEEVYEETVYPGYETAAAPAYAVEPAYYEAIAASPIYYSYGYTYPVFTPFAVSYVCPPVAYCPPPYRYYCGPYFGHSYRFYGYGHYYSGVPAFCYGPDRSLSIRVGFNFYDDDYYHRYGRFYGGRFYGHASYGYGGPYRSRSYVGGRYSGGTRYYRSSVNDLRGRYYGNRSAFSRGPSTLTPRVTGQAGRPLGSISRSAGQPPNGLSRSGDITGRRSSLGQGSRATRTSRGESIVPLRNRSGSALEPSRTSRTTAAGTNTGVRGGEARSSTSRSGHRAVLPGGSGSSAGQRGTRVPRSTGVAPRQGSNPKQSPSLTPRQGTPTQRSAPRSENSSRRSLVPRQNQPSGSSPGRTPRSSGDEMRSSTPRGTNFSPSSSGLQPRTNSGSGFLSPSRSSGTPNSAGQSARPRSPFSSRPGSSGLAPPQRSAPQRSGSSSLVPRSSGSSGSTRMPSFAPRSSGSSRSLAPSRPSGSSRSISPSRPSGSSRSMAPSRSGGSSRSMAPSRSGSSSRSLSPSRSSGGSRPSFLQRGSRGGSSAPRIGSSNRASRSPR